MAFPNIRPTVSKISTLPMLVILSLLAMACATTPAAPAATPVPPTDTPAPAVEEVEPMEQDIVDIAVADDRFETPGRCRHCRRTG